MAVPAYNCARPKKHCLEHQCFRTSAFQRSHTKQLELLQSDGSFLFLFVRKLALVREDYRRRIALVCHNKQRCSSIAKLKMSPDLILSRQTSLFLVTNNETKTASFHKSPASLQLREESQISRRRQPVSNLETHQKFTMRRKKLPPVAFVFRCGRGTTCHRVPMVSVTAAQSNKDNAQRHHRDATNVAQIVNRLYEQGNTDCWSCSSFGFLSRVSYLHCTVTKDRSLKIGLF